ncbi:MULTISPECIES: cupin domain-containing protein [Pseudomonas]|uniref:Cupin domain-containing protein n=1 Tax=Pseudomonas gregormendelii TaxID=1628277 RepID=A0ABS3AD31_9PSED|nr:MULTISPECIES: cupin domain-containing protein [Pseudomonas]KJH79043.1 cupin [Pseudomonas sp. ES3-33]MBN3965053.1 cupin domain-containing protein [Pseudomonas gregormendelii]
MSLFNVRKTAGALGLAIAATTLAAVTGLAQAQEVKSSTQDAPATKSWQTGLHRTDLLHRDMDVAGQEVLQVRVDFEPGVVSPKHSHPGVEVAYVLEGTFEYQLEGQPAVTLKAGDSLYIPAGVAHVAKNTSATTSSELATYIVKKGAPLVKIVAQ